MTDATPVPSKSVGLSGVVLWGGTLVSQDYDAAWKGAERDRTIVAMSNDPLVGAVLLGIEMLVRRVDWHVKPPDDSPAAEEAASFVQDCLDDMRDHWPGDTLARILTYLPWGWSCLELVYKRRAGAGGDPPSRFDDGKIGWHKWALRPQATRYGWTLKGDEPAVLIQQDPQTFKRFDVPLAKCLLFRYASRDNSPEGFTPLRVCFDAWYNKRKIQRIEAIGIERDLAGFPVMYVPGKEIADNSLVYQAAQTMVTNIRNDAQGGAVIAGDRDGSGNRYQELVLLSSGGTRAFDTDTVIKRYANEVVTSFLANVMRTGQDATGSYALADVQGGLFQQAIGAHLDTVAQTITEQAIGPLCRFNGIPAEIAPTLEHGDIESADLARLGLYLTNLATAGLLVDTPELRFFLHEVAGLPVPTADELAKQEEEERTAREKKAQDAAKAAQDAPAVPTNGAGPTNGQTPPATATVGQNGNSQVVPVATSEIKRFVEGDGTLTLTDLMEVVAWFDGVVDEQYRGLLNAEVVGG